MSIKQNGGVFGRNPTFNDVTIDGTLTFDGELDINSDINLPDNKKITFGDGNDLELYHSGSHSIIKETGTGQMRLQASTNVQIWNENATKLAANFNGDTQTSLYYGGNDKLTTAATGISINGNVIMLSGNGIDFSATAGTGTSELLDDYEEGVWTPTATSQTGAITTYTSSGTYTKIGRSVTITASVVLTDVGTAAGKMFISSLPFAPVATAVYLGVAREEAITGNNWYGRLATSIQINGATNNAITWTNSYEYAVSLTYITAV